MSQRHTRKNRRIDQQGLSLVELMVAMLLGLLLMGSIVQVVLTSKTTFFGQRELALVQENGRYAMEILTREIRMSGYQDCARPGASKLGVVINNTPAKWYLVGPGLKGYEGPTDSTLPATSAGGWTPTVGDSISVRHGDSSSYSLMSGTTNLIVNKITDIQPGEPLLMVNQDCNEVALFQATNAAGTTTISHAITGVSPNNCTTNLYVGAGYSSSTCSNYSTNSTAGAFLAGSTIMRYTASAFYVANSTANATPSLFRSRLVTNSGATPTLAVAVEELTQGVEDLQFLYGLDTDSTPDGIANKYVKANDSALTDWSKVVSVQITLSLRSTNSVYLNNTDYTKCDGTATVYSDKYIHKCMSSVVNIRNSGP